MDRGQKMIFLTDTAEDTTAFGERLAEMLKPGDTVLLQGDLGAGKSVLARGIARGMGVRCPMPSPTFTLMIPYRTDDTVVYHFDLYRITDEDEYFAAGLDEYIGTDGVALVEWPETVDLQPEHSLQIFIEPAGEGTGRRIRIENDGVAGYAPERLERWRWRDGSGT